MKAGQPAFNHKCVPLQGTLAQAVKKGHWILLDEINLAAAETLECLSGLLEGSAGSLVLLDRGDTGNSGGFSGSSFHFISAHFLRMTTESLNQEKRLAKTSYFERTNMLTSFIYLALSTFSAICFTQMFETIISVF